MGNIEMEKAPVAHHGQPPENRYDAVIYEAHLIRLLTVPPYADIMSKI
jgi:hypothetical protein